MANADVSGIVQAVGSSGSSACSTDDLGDSQDDLGDLLSHYFLTSQGCKD
jgi:hypothetical protein